jgi:glyceraldehyde-3-phosphate dehydrogenase/erythrose-4-phosphate dehydrogenase
MLAVVPDSIPRTTGVGSDVRMVIQNVLGLLQGESHRRPTHIVKL